MNLERQELRKSLRVLSAVRSAFAEQLDLAWFAASCDTAEEAQARHALHADRAASAGSRGGRGGHFGMG